MAIDVDSSGIYLAGKRDTDPSSQIQRWDAYIVKYSLSGSLLWSRTLAASSQVAAHDGARSIDVGPGGVYITGISEYSDGITYWSKAFVTKYSATGSRVWSRTYDAAGSGATALAVSANGAGVYITGSRGDTHSYTSGTAYYPYVRKYDANGNALWTKSWAGNTRGSAVAAYSQQLYVASYSQDTNYSIMLRKYDASGVLLWSRAFGEGIYDWVDGIHPTSSAVYVAGHASSSWSGDQSLGGDDVFLRKYTPAGSLTSHQRLGTSGGDYLNGRGALSTSGLYLGGPLNAKESFFKVTR